MRSIPDVKSKRRALGHKLAADEQQRMYATDSNNRKFTNQYVRGQLKNNIFLDVNQLPQPSAASSSGLATAQNYANGNIHKNLDHHVVNVIQAKCTTKKRTVTSSAATPPTKSAACQNQRNDAVESVNQKMIPVNGFVVAMPADRTDLPHSSTDNPGNSQSGDYVSDEARSCQPPKMSGSYLPRSCRDLELSRTSDSQCVFEKESVNHLNERKSEDEFSECEEVAMLMSPQEESPPPPPILVTQCNHRRHRYERPFRHRQECSRRLYEENLPGSRNSCREDDALLSELEVHSGCRSRTIPNFASGNPPTDAILPSYESVISSADVMPGQLINASPSKYGHNQLQSHDLVRLPDHNPLYPPPSYARLHSRLTGHPANGPRSLPQRLSTEHPSVSSLVGSNSRGNSLIEEERATGDSSLSLAHDRSSHNGINDVTITSSRDNSSAELLSASLKELSV